MLLLELLTGKSPTHASLQEGDGGMSSVCRRATAERKGRTGGWRWEAVGRGEVRRGPAAAAHRPSALGGARVRGGVGDRGSSPRSRLEAFGDRAKEDDVVGLGSGCTRGRHGCSLEAGISRSGSDSMSQSFEVANNAWCPRCAVGTGLAGNAGCLEVLILVLLKPLKKILNAAGREHAPLSPVRHRQSSPASTHGVPDPDWSSLL